MKLYKNKILIFLFLSILMIICIAPFASKSPDGLEWVAAVKGFLQKGENNPTYWKFALMPDYEIKSISHKGLSTITSGLIGLVLTMGLSMLIFNLSKKKKTWRL